MEDLFVGPHHSEYIERIQVCEKVYERLQQDPMLDVSRCLKRTFGRTPPQAKMDMEVIDIMVQSMDAPKRNILMYRARKVAESMIRAGQQMGDLKYIDKGLSQLIKIDRLDEDVDEQENIKNTAALPAVLVEVNVIDPSKQALDDDQFRQIMQKYGGKLDQIDQMIQDRKEQLLLAQRNKEPDLPKDMELLADADKFMM